MPPYSLRVLERMGCYADRVVVSAEWVFPIPERLDAASAVALGIAGLTAYAAVHSIGRAAAGEIAVVHAAAGGVGSIAIQLARNAGLEVVPVAHQGKHRWLAARGFPNALTSDNWTAALSGSHPEGVDLILDGIGPSSVATGLAHLRWGGRIVAYGAAEFVTSPTTSTLPAEVGAADLSSLALAGSGRGGLSLTLGVPPTTLCSMMEHLLNEHGRGVIDATPGGTFPLSAASEAHRAIHERRHCGKLVLIPGR
jgi:NADPH:quinone reductase